ncbi:MAG: exodeoxyribonuclease VII large subunit, partial [Halomonas sp.]
DRRRRDQLARRLAAHPPERQLAQADQRLQAVRRRLATAAPRELSRHCQRLAGVVRELQAVSPLAVLGRGYAILEDSRGRVVRRAAETAPGERLAARLGEGRLTLEVLDRDTRPQGRPPST